MITQIEKRLYRLDFIIVYCLLSIVYFFSSSCQKEITVDLPDAKQKIVVDGRIEQGLPPYIILTHNMPYFGPTDINTIQNMFIHGAVIKISNGTTTVTLTEYCTNSLSGTALAMVASFTGVDTSSLKNFNYCLYTTLNSADTGMVGKTYSLSIDVEGKLLTASTTILNPIPLDSVWFKYMKANSQGDSLGFIYAHLTDPPQEENSYRWLAMRIGKDYSFIAPYASVFDDKFINGKSFEFAYDRGQPPSATTPENMDELGYYKKGDTVTVKFCTIDNASYKFFRDMEVALNSEGNPFAAPSSIASNIYPRAETMGVWCGYGVYRDTVIFK